MQSFTVLTALLLAALAAMPASAHPRLPARAPYPLFPRNESTSITSIGHNCDISSLTIPTAPTPLAAPPAPPSHIFIGRGTQNYTCDLSNSTAVPTPIGAIATLYDASCIAQADPSLSTLNFLTAAAYNTRTSTLPTLSTDATFVAKFAKSAQTTGDAASTFLQSYVAGHHFFTNATAARFDLDTPNGDQGTVTVGKVGISDPPAGSVEGSVPWLYLQAAPGQSYQAVYRVQTIGGEPPSTCKEAGAAMLEIRYAAQYWFFA